MEHCQVTVIAGRVEPLRRLAAYRAVARQWAWRGSKGQRHHYHTEGFVNQRLMRQHIGEGYADDQCG